MKPRVLSAICLCLAGPAAAHADGISMTASQTLNTAQIQHAVGQYGGYISPSVRNMDPLGSLGGNAGYKNTGSGNIGAFNSGTGNIGAFNGNRNTSPTSGNHNVGAFNGNGNTGTYDGNGNVGAFNGNGNGGSFNGNGNLGSFNGNFNGQGNH